MPDFVLNPHLDRSAAYGDERRSILSLDAARTAHAAISGWSGYAPTPLRDLPAVADQLDLPVERVVSNIAEVGNTVAASIPLALAHGLRQGILRDGGNMVLTGFGAGLTWGSVALRWPKIVPTMD